MYYNKLEVINLANKDLKTRTPIGNSVNTTIWNNVKKYSDETGIPLSKILDKALKSFLESTKK
jgi:hypothetical protein